MRVRTDVIVDIEEGDTNYGLLSDVALLAYFQEIDTSITLEQALIVRDLEFVAGQLDYVDIEDGTAAYTKVFEYKKELLGYYWEDSSRRRSYSGNLDAYIDLEPMVMTMKPYYEPKHLPEIGLVELLV